MWQDAFFGVEIKCNNCIYCQKIRDMNIRFKDAEGKWHDYETNCVYATADKQTYTLTYDDFRSGLKIITDAVMHIQPSSANGAIIKYAN